MNLPFKKKQLGKFRKGIFLEVCFIFNLKNKFMSKAIIAIMLLILSSTSFSQQINSSETLYQKDYSQKSKRRRTVAQIIISSGGSLILIGAIYPKGKQTSSYSNYSNFNFNIWGVDYDTYKNDNIKNTLVLSGFVCILGSIPFFIASHHNKRKAKATTTFLKMEKMPVIQQTSFVSQSYPALGIKINL